MPESYGSGRINFILNTISNLKKIYDRARERRDKTPTPPPIPVVTMIKYCNPNIDLQLMRTRLNSVPGEFNPSKTFNPLPFMTRRSDMFFGIPAEENFILRSLFLPPFEVIAEEIKSLVKDTLPGNHPSEAIEELVGEIVAMKGVGTLLEKPSITVTMLQLQSLTNLSEMLAKNNFRGEVEMDDVTKAMSHLAIFQKLISGGEDLSTKTELIHGPTEKVVTLTAWQLTSLIRIIRRIANLRSSVKVEICDVIPALLFFENTMKQSTPPVPNDANGLDHKSYTWRQSEQELNVTIPVPPGTKSEFLVCVIEEKHIKVGFKGLPPILEGELYKSVNVDDCYWNLEDQKSIFILLTKSDTELWRCVVKGEPEVHIQEDEPESSDLDSETRSTVEKMMTSDTGLDPWERGASTD